MLKNLKTHNQNNHNMELSLCLLAFHTSCNSTMFKDELHLIWCDVGIGAPCNSTMFKDELHLDVCNSLIVKMLWRK